MLLLLLFFEGEMTSTFHALDLLDIPVMLFSRFSTTCHTKTAGATTWSDDTIKVVFKGVERGDV